LARPLRVIERGRTREYGLRPLLSRKESFLIGDALLDKLGVILLEPEKGYWEFGDEPKNIIKNRIHAGVHTQRQTARRRTTLTPKNMKNYAMMPINNFWTATVILRLSRQVSFVPNHTD